MVTTAAALALFAADTGHLAASDGAAIHYRMIGAGPDTVVVPLGVLLAGPLEALGRGRTVIFYDPRGRGRSAPIADPARLGFDIEVRDLEDVRAHFGLSRMSLVGYSYLGAVAAAYAARFPARVDRLVLLGAMGPDGPAEPGSGLARLDSSRLADLQRRFASASLEDPVGFCREFWDTYLPLYLGDRGGAAPALALLAATCSFPNERPGAFLRTLAPVMPGVAAAELRRLAPAIQAPVLAVHGDADHVVPIAAAAEWIRLVPKGRLVTIAGAGHLLWSEAHGEVVRALDEFLPRK